MASVNSSVDIVTDPADAAAVAAVAAATFPLACPPHSPPEAIAAHIADRLSAEQFVTYITGSNTQVLALRESGVIGYSLLVYGMRPDDENVLAAVEGTPEAARALAGGTIVEVSKMYVLPDHHGEHAQTRPAHTLMQASLDAARDAGATYAWLGVNSLNERARKYYRKMGFVDIGTRTFDLGGSIENDYVMGRPVE